LNVSQRPQGRLYLAVVQHLKQAIDSGVYPVGGRLPSERALAEQMGVSRPVVREAIIILESRGMVQTRHGAGVFVQSNTEMTPEVTGHSLSSPFEVIEARRLLEGEIAALAAELVTDRDIDEMQSLMDRINDIRLDNASREKAECALHVTLARSTQNEVLVGMVENLWDTRYQSALCEYLFRRAREIGIESPTNEHQKVIEALKAREPEAARSAMREHLARVAANLLVATKEDVRERARLRIPQERFDVARRTGPKVGRSRAAAGAGTSGR
jgi:GntR family transcriptional repressor for pyruvate dehydrogenase complex